MSALALAFLLAADPEPAAVAKAEAFVKALAKGDFDAAFRDFDDAMTKAMPLDRLRATWGTLSEKVGAFEKVAGTRTETKVPYNIVILTCQFAKGKLDFRIVVDANNRIAGLQVRAPYQPPDYVKPDAFEEAEVDVGEDKTWVLPGTLSRPKAAAGPLPAVVLVHGSGPQDRDETIGPNKPFLDLAGGLASRGVAVIRYDKRTKVYGKTIRADAITVDTETVDDVRNALTALRKTKGIDPKRLYVLGHSLGATMAPRVAEREPALAGIVLMAGTTRPLEDVIVDQVTYIGSLPGGDAAKGQVEKLKEAAARVKDPKLSPETPAKELPLGMPAAYWLSLRGYDPAATAAKLSCRVLVLHGDRDYQVTLDDFAGWEKALADKPTVTLKRFPDLNHLFMQGKGKATPAEYEKTGHVAAEVVDVIAAWVTK